VPSEARQQRAALARRARPKAEYILHDPPSQVCFPIPINMPKLLIARVVRVRSCVQVRANKI
ncbi:hypothetical protein, partial [Lonsdalea quercina]|uniref:hypothetical protein n=1 Tax=Lonsdalea quercina TaxID=71657 RepID=UPI003974755D